MSISSVSHALLYISLPEGTGFNHDRSYRDSDSPGTREADPMLGQQHPAKHDGQHYFSGPVQEAITLCRKDQRFLLIFLKGEELDPTK